MNRAIVFLLILISVFAVSQASASDLDDIAFEDADDAILAVDNYAPDEINSDDSDVSVMTQINDEPIYQETGIIHSLNSEINTFDDIQKAIDEANDGDTIELNGTFVFSGNNETIKVNKSLTIAGADDKAIIKYDSLNTLKKSFFNVESPNVILRNLILTGGKGPNGGSVVWHGDAGKIINCEFTKSTAGGAVLILGNDCTVQDSIFTENQADSFGGAIYWNGNDGILINCIFTNNKANQEGGAIYWIGNCGKVTNSKFKENEATADKGHGGAIVLNGNNCFVDLCNFTDNHCTGYGGAISSLGQNNTINNSEFNGNYVSGNLTDGQGGGAIYSNEINCVVDNCRFTNNKADQSYGGAIRIGENDKVKNSYFNGNAAQLGNDIYGDNFILDSNFIQLDYGESENDAIYGNDITKVNNVFNKTKIGSEIIFKAGIVFNYGQTGSIYVTVKGGTILLSNIKVLNNNNAKIGFRNNVITVSNLPVGKYTLRVTTSPDENHTAVYKDLTITVKKAFASVSSERISVQLKKASYWSCTITDSKSHKPISGMKVIIKVYTGKKYKKVTKTTNSKGIVKYKTSALKIGKHTVKVSATHPGYNSLSFKSSVNVVKPKKLTFKVKHDKARDNTAIEFWVFNKKTKKPAYGVKFYLKVYTGKKVVKTIPLKTKRINKLAIVGYATNELSAGTHKVVLVPASVKYSGSKVSTFRLTSTQVKYPPHTFKITAKV